MKICFNGSEDESLNTKVLEVTPEEHAAAKIRKVSDAIRYVFENEPRAHRSFYKTDGTLANGTICFINDQDLEILDEHERVVSENDTITFISTLHGG